MGKTAKALTVCVTLLFFILTACGTTNNQEAGTEQSPDNNNADTTQPETDETNAEAPASVESYPTEAINIMAPASPGGGWDQTARSLQSALTSSTGQNAQVYNVPGAGGTVGLAQFTSDNAGDAHQLMIMGLVMVGAIQTNNAPVTLDQVTPIATLTTEWMAVVVPTNSEYQTIEQLMEAFQADPTSISWGGGSAGGTDHILVGLLAQAAEVDPGSINYVAHSGGGEALASILSGSVTAGVSGVSEFIDQVEAGELRLLAVSSEENLEGIDAPTMQESGFDVVLPNWRAVVAPPDISAEDQAAIIAAVETMHATAEWQNALETNGWNDFFTTGDEFAQFLTEENERIGGVLSNIGLIE